MSRKLYSDQQPIGRQGEALVKARIDAIGFDFNPSDSMEADIDGIMGVVRDPNSKAATKLHADLKRVLLEPPGSIRDGGSLPLERRATSAPRAGRSSGLRHLGMPRGGNGRGCFVLRHDALRGAAHSRRMSLSRMARVHRGFGRLQGRPSSPKPSRARSCRCL